MTFFRPWLAADNRRRAILLAVGACGLLITGWVTSSLHVIERDRLELRFASAAQARANELAEQLRQPLDQLGTLQRLFASVDQVDGPAFKKFTEAMLSQPGVRSLSWLPRVSAGEREAFERDSRALSGERIAITEYDASGATVAAGVREQYFPLLYSVPETLGRAPGFDLYSRDNRRPLIDRAIADDVPIASEIGPLAGASEVRDATMLLAPVYRQAVPAASRAERIADTHGVVMLVFSVGKLFSAANGSLSDIGLDVRLIDLKRPVDDQTLAVWPSRLAVSGAAADTDALRYARRVDLSSHDWSVLVEATPAWVELNAARGLFLVPLVGVLATLLLLFYLRALLGRSALADRLEVSHEDGLRQRRAAEAWANKLSLAVEQNPSAIYIIDLAGRIEYVNQKFVDTSGYSRAEVIGTDSRAMRPDDADEAVYQSLWATIESG